MRLHLVVLCAGAVAFKHYTAVDEGCEEGGAKEGNLVSGKRGEGEDGGNIQYNDGDEEIPSHYSNFNARVYAQGKVDEPESGFEAIRDKE